MTTSFSDKDHLMIHMLVQSVVRWHEARNLIDGATDKDQVLKLIQEVGELSDNVCKGQDIRDDIGDIMVVLINIMARNGLTLEECLEVAYDDIKDRKGRMVDGIFIKEADERPVDSVPYRHR
jgi:NTP pyrophosphatase (non-canonical NTP hydrolase)